MVFRPVLRPGAPVLRRDATRLQVGTSPGVVVADRPGLVTLLRLLDAARDVDTLVTLAAARGLDLDVRAEIARLVATGVVVDGALSPRPRLALVVQEDRPGSAAGRMVRTVVEGLDLLPDPAAERLAVVVCHGEPPRQLFERVALQRVAHLPVVLDEDRVRVGPLVVPGRTPCLSCLDEARAVWDPAWSAVLQQVGRPILRAAWAPDPALLWIAAATVGAQAAALSRAERAETVGATVTLGPEPSAREVHAVPFHHRCGCSLLTAS